MPDQLPPSTSCDLKNLLDAVQVDHHREDSGERLQVEELGREIDPPYERYTRPSSMATLSSLASWRSTSVASKASVSTEVTSNYSIYSNDNHFSIRRPGSLPSYHTCDTVSVSTVSIEGIPTFPRSTAKRAPYESSTTLLQDDSPPPKKHFRRLRSLNFRSLYRTGSKTSLAEISVPYATDVPIHVIRGNASRPQTSRATTAPPPTHVGSSSTSRLVRHSDRPAKYVDAIVEEGQSPRVDTIAAKNAKSGTLDKPHLEQHPLPIPSHGIHTQFLPEETAERATTIDRERLHEIMQRPDYQDLIISQTADRDEFLSLVSKQRTELDAANDLIRSRSKTTQQAAVEDLHESHMLSLHEAEDKQVLAEASLLETQAKETRDLAIATRHMEAYCAGHYSTNLEPHHRPVTPADRAELSNALHLRDHLLPTRHAAAVNVLRGEQARRLRMRSARHDQQVRELLRHQRMEELEMERACSAEISRWRDDVHRTKVRLICRWEVQMACLEQRIAAELGIDLDWRLPCVELNECDGLGGGGGGKEGR